MIEKSVMSCYREIIILSSFQTMGRDDFAETIACFMRVAWAAAAGRINLAGGRQRLSSQSSDDEGSSMGGGGSDSESVKSFRSSVSSGSPSEITNKVCQ